MSIDEANQFCDTDGNPCTLDELCRREPGWAASRIRVEREETAVLRARLAQWQHHAKEMEARDALDKDREARKDALVEELRSSLAQAEKSWRCFHCNEVFHDEKQALAHFGASELANPACTESAERLRDLEARLARYAAEDTDMDRKYHAMQADHVVEIRRSEEAGYARGLGDYTALEARLAQAEADLFAARQAVLTEGVARNAAEAELADLKKRYMDAVDEVARGQQSAAARQRCLDEERGKRIFAEAENAELQHWKREQQQALIHLSCVLMDCGLVKSASDDCIEVACSAARENAELRKLCGRAAGYAQDHLDAIEGITPDVERELASLRADLEAAARRAGK